MRNIKEMPLEKIIKNVDLKFKIEDIKRFCKSEEASNELSNRIIQLKDKAEIARYLIENEDKIDKEKLIFITAMRFKEEILNDEKVYEKLLKENNKSGKEYIKLNKMENILKEDKRHYLAAKKLCSGLDSYIVFITSKSDGTLTKINITSSREEITGIDLTEKERKNEELFRNINNLLVNEKEKNMGIGYALQFLEVDDLLLVLPEDIAKAIMYKAISNTRITCKEEVEKIENGNLKEEDIKEYRRLNNEVREKSIIPEIEKGILDTFKYIDLPKLLLIGTYRFEEILEDDRLTIKGNGIVIIEDIIKNILKCIPNNTSVQIENKIDEQGKIEVIKYDYEDVKALLSRIDGENNLYLSKKESKDLMNRLLDGNTLEGMTKEELLKINMIDFNKKELLSFMKNSKENFAFAMEKLALSEKEIIEKVNECNNEYAKSIVEYLLENNKISSKSAIELFYNGTIDVELFKKFSNDIDILSEIDLNKIHERYLEIKHKETNNENILKKQIELYKTIKITGRDKEELQEISDNIMYELAENFEDDKDLLFYYKNGLITLQTIIEWSGEKLIENLYNSSNINFQDIEELYKEKKVSQELIQKILLEMNFEPEKFMEYVLNGYIGEKEIIKAYENGKIYEQELKKAYENGFVSEISYNTAVEKMTKEKLEEKTNTSIIPSSEELCDREFILNVESLPDNKNELKNLEKGKKIKEQGYDYKEWRKISTLIDPNIRYKFLKLLRIRKADQVKGLDENSPFYNYEFYAITDKQGKINLDTVIIAERFYEDKDDQKEFATLNATYFFKYKDFLVNNNRTKKEIAKEKENIIFTANHRSGSWAMSVLYRVAQTMASSNLKQYKKGDERANAVLDELLKMYNPEEIKQILNLAGEIDDSESYTYDIYETTKNSRKENKDDDNYFDER